jgi:hypothetical protein
MSAVERSAVRAREIGLLASSDGEDPRACPSGGVGPGGGWGWSLDRATYDNPEPMLRCGRLPPPPFFEAYLRDLAMHLVWRGGRSRLASPLVGGIATAFGSPPAHLTAARSLIF